MKALKAFQDTDFDAIMNIQVPVPHFPHFKTVETDATFQKELTTGNAASDKLRLEIEFKEFADPKSETTPAELQSLLLLSFLITPQGEITDISHAFCKLLGYQQEELIGVNVASPDESFVQHGHITKLQQTLGSLSNANSVPPPKLQVKVKKQSGESIWLELDFHLGVTTKMGRLREWIMIHVEDVTEWENNKQLVKLRYELSYNSKASDEQVRATFSPNFCWIDGTHVSHS